LYQESSEKVAVKGVQLVMKCITREKYADNVLKSFSSLKSLLYGIKQDLPIEYWNLLMGEYGKLKQAVYGLTGLEDSLYIPYGRQRSIKVFK